MKIMTFKMLRQFIVKMSVLGYFPLCLTAIIYIYLLMISYDIPVLHILSYVSLNRYTTLNKYVIYKI